MRQLLTTTLSLTFLSCTPHRCGGRGEVGPLPPPAPYVTDDNIFHASHGPKLTTLQFNPNTFSVCAGLEVVYDGTDYGLVLPTTPVHVTHNVGKHTLEIRCLNEESETLIPPSTTVEYEERITQ